MKKKMIVKKPTQEELNVTLLRSITGLETQFAELKKFVKDVNQHAVYMDKRLIEVERAAPAAPAAPKPKEYVLTESDWQRVIDEKWLCEFQFHSFDDPNNQVVGVLKAKKCMPSPFQQERGAHYPMCRPLNKPGVMQPYFGQGCPVSDGTKVHVMFRRGNTVLCRASEVTWVNPWNVSQGDIVAYMVIPTVGEVT